MANDYFSGKKINLRVNEKNVVGEINRGVISFPLTDFDEKISVQKINFEDVGIIFSGEDNFTIVAPKNHYKDGLVALLGVMIILGLAFKIHKKNNPDADRLSDLIAMTDSRDKILPPVEEGSSKKNLLRKVFYAGKLIIYVTRTPEGEELEPREFNLLRVNASNIRLSEILSQCSIYETFKGTEKIFISPQDKGIVISNKSDCTITRLNVLTEKGAPITMNYNDSLNVVTADAAAEVLLIYKSLKPN